ncbi:protein-tyrosine phosphatase [Nakamurella panacisegetis]|uniref:protein-tyrosine-phosphatase n=1 Tax=Nakamurella panacisegetis TaxID=1090615 RepID=A0A1H0QYX8_9ACTN|nr:low molecular weight protein-tyrosine-phosphatase [Nakamurella panacisegetis]SDP22454.1 protein-tyrosine phosphatase [Nakamurella panacisegetis]
MTSPAPSRPFHVSVVCTGNICRSPIGEQMLRAALVEAGLDQAVRVSSAGTGNWHVGHPADRQAQAALRRAGFPVEHRAHQITEDELRTIDLALAADRGHEKVLRRMTSDPDKIRLLRSFDPEATTDDVPDPYQGPDSEFDEVVAMTAAAIPGVLREIRRRLG